MDAIGTHSQRRGAPVQRTMCTRWRSPRASWQAVSERCEGRRVVQVTLVIGALSGVVPDSVRFCFELATAGTPLAGATLEIVEVRRPGPLPGLRARPWC